MYDKGLSPWGVDRERTPWAGMAPGWGAMAPAVMPGPTGGSGGMSRRAFGPCSGAGAGAVACSLRPAVVLMLAAAGTVVAVEAVSTFAAGFTWFSPLGFLTCKMTLALVTLRPHLDKPRRGCACSANILQVLSMLWGPDWPKGLSLQEVFKTNL